MTAINRCAVGIGPRQPLIDWIRQVSGDHEVRWGANEDGLYLLPEYEDDSEAVVVLEDNYERIFKAELQSLTARHISAATVMGQPAVGSGVAVAASQSA
jgi:hypothetical protein